MISILLPVHNGEDTLSQTLNSIFNQDFHNFELLLIDDGSSDQSSKIYNEYNDPRMRIFKNKQAGLAATLNFGLKEASFDLISRIDQDDLMEPNYLTKHLEVFRDYPKKICVTHWAWKIDEKGEICGKIMPSQDDALQQFEILFINKYVHSGITFKKSEVLKLGGYPTDISVQPPEDFFLWSKIFTSYNNPFYVIPLFLTRYRVRNNSMTQSNPVIAENAKNIALYNLSQLLIHNGEKSSVWAHYASSMIHDQNSFSSIRQFPYTLLFVYKLFRTCNVKFSIASLRVLLEIIARIHLPHNLRNFVKFFYLGKT
jgi:glycosyltransferase involved in cell wall biosynthesis